MAATCCNSRYYDNMAVTWWSTCDVVSSYFTFLPSPVFYFPSLSHKKLASSKCGKKEIGENNKKKEKDPKENSSERENGEGRGRNHGHTQTK